MGNNLLNKWKTHTCMYTHTHTHTQFSTLKEVNILIEGFEYMRKLQSII